MSTNTAMTEETLRAAAQACVESGHAVSAVLFGSRVRGTAGRLSDWDVCLITDDGEIDETTRQTRLEAEQPVWETPGIETHWLERSRFEEGVPIGSLEANIVRDGRVLAGDGTVVKARLLPFEAKTVLDNIGWAAHCLRHAMRAAGSSRPGIEDGERDVEYILMVQESLRGARAIRRALCALTETGYTEGHNDGNTDGKREDIASEGELPLRRNLIDAISEKGQKLQASTQTRRKVEQYEPGEAKGKTIARYIHALEADLWLRQGLLHGEGPWAGLKEHPRRGDLREDLAQATKGDATMNRDAWRATRHGVANPQLREAITRWVTGINLLAEQERIAG